VSGISSQKQRHREKRWTSKENWRLLWIYEIVGLLHLVCCYLVLSDIMDIKDLKWQMTGACTANTENKGIWNNMSHGGGGWELNK